MTYQDMREAARAAELRVERTRLGRVLRNNGWSPRAAAMELEISSSTLYRALERHPALREQLADKSPSPGRQKK